MSGEETSVQSAPQAFATRSIGRRGIERFAWIDTARGMTMVLVVLLHADHVADHIGNQVLLITLLNYALFPMRMPMFFLISGLLAAGLLRRSAGEVMRRRVLHYAWLYTLWLVLYSVVHTWALRDLGSPVLQAEYVSIQGPISALIVTGNEIWFLYALMLFFLAALLLRRLPVAAQAAIALALAVPGLLKLGAAVGLPVIDRFYHFPYFMLGILGAEHLRDTLPRLGRLRIFVPLAVTCLVLAALAHQQRIVRDPSVVTALSLIAVPAGIGLAVWLTRHVPRLMTPLQLVGRNTLAIYVLHTITLRLLLAYVPPPGGLLDVVWLVGLTLGAVALAVALGKLLEPIPGLFGLPWNDRSSPRRTSSEPVVRST